MTMSSRKIFIKAVTLGCRGIFCPSEAWRVAANALTDENVPVFLSNLNRADADRVRAFYHQRPESLESLAASEPDLQLSQLLHFAQTQPADSELDH